MTAYTLYTTFGGISLKTMQAYILLVGAIGLGNFTSLLAAPVGNAVAAGGIQEVRHMLSSLQYNINNHAQELRQANERFATVEEIVSGLRQELTDFRQQQPEQQKQATAPFKVKIRALEEEQQRLSAHLQQIKNNLQEALALFAQYRKSLEEIQKQDAIRDKNIEHLHAALDSLMEAMQPQEIGAKKDTYRVKSGDSLEKIAQTHHTTVKVLKELNALTTDRIRIGQELKLP